MSYATQECHTYTQSCVPMKESKCESHFHIPHMCEAFDIHMWYMKSHTGYVSPWTSLSVSIWHSYVVYESVISYTTYECQMPHVNITPRLTPMCLITTHSCHVAHMSVTPRLIHMCHIISHSHFETTYHLLCMYLYMNILEQWHQTHIYRGNNMFCECICT